MAKVAREVGVVVATLERWRSEAQSRPARAKTWTAGARLEAVIATAAMDEASKNAWCRKRGLYPADLEMWCGSAIAALGRHTLATRFPGVFAIGDVTAIALANGRPLPKAGVLAHAQADVVADNLVREITGKGEPRAFDGHSACFIETGDGRARFGSGDFFAEPAPRIRLRPPGRLLHLGKVLYEQYWLGRWF